MYIKTETFDSWFDRKSKKGNKHRYKRTKTTYHLSCDYCGTAFIRHKGEMDPKRFGRDYKHFCSECYNPTRCADLGRETFRNNLNKKIGERRIDSQGYVTIYMGKTHPYTKSYGGAIREHIVVMENHIKRALNSENGNRRTGNAEVVHHIDGNRQNNTLSNLQLMTVKEHNACHGSAGSLIFALYKMGIVGYNKKIKRYYIYEK